MGHKGFLSPVEEGKKINAHQLSKECMLNDKIKCLLNSDKYNKLNEKTVIIGRLTAIER